MRVPKPKIVLQKIIDWNMLISMSKVSGVVFPAYFACTVGGIYQELFISKVDLPLLTWCNISGGLNVVQVFHCINLVQFLWQRIQQDTFSSR